MSEPNLRALAAEAGLDPDRVFSAPWEARAFAIALAMAQSGLFSWDEFRANLIAEVGASDRVRERDGTADRGEYYHHFLSALERTIAARGLIGAGEIARKLSALAEPEPPEHRH
jgi:nitrile hydratase accessory protein